jgi:hypothetical protein
MEVDSSLLWDVQKGQLEDEKIQEIKCNIKVEGHLNSQKITKDFCGIKEGFVCLMSRS